jgi:hypothetical protein
MHWIDEVLTSPKCSRPQLTPLAQGNKDVSFDIETAIKACRSSGYYPQALHLAHTHRKPDWYLLIQIEDVQNHADAIAYLATLPFTEVHTALLRAAHAAPDQIR